MPKLGRACNRKRSASPASEEETNPAIPSKRRVLPQVEVRIYRAPSPVTRLDSSPIAPRCLESHPTRSGFAISSVDASTPQSSESSQKSPHQDRYSTRSRMPVPARSTRDIASDLIRTVSPELGDPILHTPYERRVNRTKLTPDIVSALHFLHRQDVAHFHRLNIDDVSMPDFGRLNINSLCSTGCTSTHKKGRDLIEAADPEIQPELREQSEPPQSLQPSLDQVSVAPEMRDVESTSPKDGLSTVTQCLEPVEDSCGQDPCGPHPVSEPYSGDLQDHFSTQNLNDYDSPMGDGITPSNLDVEAHISHPSTTFDDIPSAIWFWGRLRGHARYPNFDEDRFRRICRDYMEKTRHGLSDDKSVVKSERDSGDDRIIETRLDDGDTSEASTIILEPSTKIEDLKRARSRHDVLLKSNDSIVPRVSQSPWEPSLGLSAENVIQANVDLPLMRALCDENNFDNILSRLDTASLINVTKATTLIPFSHFQRKYWDIDQAFVDCLGPRGRPFALRFFSRLKTSRVAMDIFVPKERYRKLMDHIRNVQQFRWKACESSWHIAQSMGNAVRSITRFGKAETILSVFSAEDIPLRALLCCMANSSLLNIISHSNAYSLFPRETFLNHQLCYFQGHHVPRQSDVGPAVASWEWQGTRLVEHDTCTINLTSPEFQETRRIGDRYTWIMPFAALSGPTRSEEVFEAREELERHTFQLESGFLSFCGLCKYYSSKEPHIKVEPAERPPTSVPIPPSRGFLRDMRDHGVARVPPPNGEWNAGVLFGSESEGDSDGELPGGHLYEERRQIRLLSGKEAAESGPDPFLSLSKTQRRQRVRRLEEQRLRISDHVQESSQAGMSDVALGKRPAR